MYRVRRRHQLSQARKANIDYRIGDYFLPEKVARQVYGRQETEQMQMKIELP